MPVPAVARLLNDGVPIAPYPIHESDAPAGAIALVRGRLPSSGALDRKTRARYQCPDNSRVWRGMTQAYLMDSEMLGRELAGETRSERMEQRVKPTMKHAIEFAAALSGTDTSEFVSMAAFQAAMDRINSTRRVRLIGDDAERFFAALDGKAEPNEAMRKLMSDHADHMDDG